MQAEWAFPGETYPPIGDAVPLPGWDEILKSFLVDDGYSATRSFESFYFKMGTPIYDILSKMMEYWRPWDAFKRNDLTKKLAPFPGGVPQLLQDEFGAREKSWVRVLSPLLNLQENYAYYIYRLHFDHSDAATRARLGTVNDILSTYFKQRSAEWHFLRIVVDKVTVGLARARELDQEMDMDDDDLEDTKAANLQAYLLDPLVEEGDGKALLGRLVAHVQRLYSTAGPPSVSGAALADDLVCIQPLSQGDLSDFIEDLLPKHAEAWRQQSEIEAELALDTLSRIFYYLLQRDDDVDGDYFVTTFLDLVTIGIRANFGYPVWTQPSSATAGSIGGSSTSKQAAMELRWLGLFCTLLSVGELAGYKLSPDTFGSSNARLQAALNDGSSSGSGGSHVLPLLRLLWTRFAQGQKRDAEQDHDHSFASDAVDTRMLVPCTLSLLDSAMGAPHATSVETLFKAELFCDEIPAQTSIAASCSTECVREGHVLLAKLVAITTSVIEPLLCTRPGALRRTLVPTSEDQQYQYDDQLALARLVRALFRGDQALADQHECLYRAVVDQWLPSALASELTMEPGSGEAEANDLFTTENADLVFAAASGLAVNHRSANIFMAALHTLAAGDALVLVSREVQGVTVRVGSDGHVERSALGAFNLVPPGTAPVALAEDPAGSYGGARVVVQWPIRCTLLDVLLERLFMQPSLVVSRFRQTDKPHLALAHLRLMDDALRFFLSLLSPMQADVNAVLILCDRALELEETRRGEMRRPHSRGHHVRREAVVVELLGEQVLDLCRVLAADASGAEERAVLHELLVLVLMCLKQLAALANWDVKDYFIDFSDTIDFTETVRGVLLYQLCPNGLLESIDTITQQSAARDTSLASLRATFLPFDESASQTFALVVTLTSLFRSLITRPTALDGVDQLARFFGATTRMGNADIVEDTCCATVKRHTVQDRLIATLRASPTDVAGAITVLFPGDSDTAAFRDVVSFFGRVDPQTFACPRLQNFCRRIALNTPSAWGAPTILEEHTVVAVRFAFQVLGYVDTGLDYGQYLRTKVGCTLAAGALGILQDVLGLAAPTVSSSADAGGKRDGGARVDTGAGCAFMVQRLREDASLRRSLLRLALFPSLSALRSNIRDAQGLGTCACVALPSLFPVRYIDGIMGVIDLDPNEVEPIALSAMIVANRIIELELLESVAAGVTPSSRLAAALFESIDSEKDGSIVGYGRHARGAGLNDGKPTLLTALCALIDFPDIPGNCKYVNALPKGALKLLGSVVQGVAGSFHAEATVQALGVHNVASFAQSVASMLRQSTKDADDAYVGQAAYALDLLLVLARYEPLTLGTLLCVRSVRDMEAKTNDREEKLAPLSSVIGASACHAAEGAVVQNVIELIDMILYEREETSEPCDAFQLVQHLVLELVMEMAVQDSTSLREAAHTVLTSDSFWPAVVRRIATPLPDDPVIPETGSEDVELTKRVMNYCFAVHAAASSLRLLALQRQRGCISVLTEKEHEAISSTVSARLEEEQRHSPDLWRDWIRRFSRVVDGTGAHTRYARCAAANLGLDLDAFVWTQSHLVPHRVGLAVRPLGMLFVTTGRYVYDCQAVERFTGFLPAPDEARSGEVSTELGGQGAAQSTVQALCAHFVQRVNCLNYAWAVVEARSNLLKRFTHFMIFYVQPSPDTAVGGVRVSQRSTPGTPVSHTGVTGASDTPSDRKASSFVGDNRSYAVLKALRAELCGTNPNPDMYDEDSEQGEGGEMAQSILDRILAAEAKQSITTVQATLLEQKTSLLKDMFYHQVEEITARRVSPALSDTRAHADSHLSPPKKDAFIGDCLALVRHRCLNVQVATFEGNPDLCERMRRRSLLNLLTCILLLWGSLADRDWRALPDDRANGIWMRRRLEVFAICRNLLLSSVDVQGHPLDGHDDEEAESGLSRGWTMLSTALRLIRLVLPSAAELDSGATSSSGVARMKVEYMETWRHALSPATMDRLSFADVLIGVVRHLSTVPASVVHAQHDLSRWADNRTAVDKAGRNTAALRDISSPSAAAAAAEAASVAATCDDPCTQLSCLSTALEIAAAVCVRGAVVDALHLGSTVIDILSSSELLTAFRDASIWHDESRAALMPYSSLTREPSPITEVWHQTLRLLTSVLDTVGDTGDVATCGPLVSCVKTFLTRFGALVILPVRPCSFRYSLGQLRLAEASLQLLLRLHPKGAQAAQPLWAVLLPNFFASAYDRVRAMVRATALLLGDTDAVGSDVDLRGFQLDRKTIAVSSRERRHAPQGAGVRRGDRDRDASDRGGASLTSRARTDSRASSGFGDQDSETGSVGTGGFGFGGGGSSNSSVVLSVSAPTAPLVKSEFLASAEVALLRVMLPSIMLLSRIASAQEIRARATASTAAAPSASMALVPADDSRVGADSFSSTSNGALDEDLFTGLYPPGTELWFHPDTTGSGIPPMTATLQCGRVIRHCPVRSHRGATAAGQTGASPQALVLAQHSGRDVLTESMQQSLTHSSMNGMEGGAGSSPGTGGNGNGSGAGAVGFGMVNLTMTARGVSGTHMATPARGGHGPIGVESGGWEGAYHVQGPDAGDAVVVRSAQVAYTTPPLLPLRDAALLKQTTDAAALSSDASLQEDPCTTAHMLRLAAYALSPGALERVREAEGASLASSSSVAAGRLARTASDTPELKLLDAIGGHALLTVASVLMLLARVRSEVVLEETRKASDLLRRLIVDGRSDPSWIAFGDATKRAIDDEVTATDTIMQHRTGHWEAAMAAAHDDEDDEEFADPTLEDGADIADY